MEKFSMAYQRRAWSAIETFGDRARRRRMSACAARMRLSPGQRIIDLGGMPDTWAPIDIPLKLTLLNLPGTSFGDLPPQHEIELVEGDACDAKQFRDESFDIAFSNSVIEHVGDDTRQAQFAREARRLARSYWVQTPAIWFPIEAHTGIPFWFFYPERLRQRFIKHWRSTLPDWSVTVEGTRVLHRRRLEKLFPDAEIFVERYGGIPKSYTAHRVR